MTATDISDWLTQCSEMAGYWYIKRLSGNDTQATGGHQAGPYLARDDVFQIFPELNLPNEENPRISINATSDSHRHTAPVNAIWYNNRLRGGTRNETRITGWGGAGAPLLDTDNTGAIAMFFFTGEIGSRECRYWICRDEGEQDVAEAFAGPVEPGQLILWNSAGEVTSRSATEMRRLTCWLEPEELPSQWLERFPSPRNVFDTALELTSYRELPLDKRIIRRRECEFAVFRSIEHATESKIIQRGFESIDLFIARAQTILQRRKSRSGRSLEFQLQEILGEENISCAFQPTTEFGKKPDFIFPSQRAYNDPDYPDGRLRMLAAKTTVKERWRQILSEADRISEKHLFTLQEGVSERQFAQMRESRIHLVVPGPLHGAYPQSVRPHLMTLQDFVDEINSI